MRRVRVIVIGAGVSGLAAALTLVQGGVKDVLVLEAAPRPGGRVRTIEYGGHVLEIGAQWIHGDEGNPIYELAEEKGLVHKELMDNSTGSQEMLASPFKTLKGKSADEPLVRQVNNAVKTILAKAAAIGKSSDPRASLASFWDEEFSKLCHLPSDSLEVRQLKAGLSKWHEGLINVQNACSSVADLSLCSIAAYEVPGVNEFCELERGYQSVLDTVLLSGLVGYIKTGVAATRVNLQSPEVNNGNAAVTVTVNDGSVGSQRIEADHVIVTTSLGFLKRHSPSFFEPALPERKAKAVANLQFGTVNKIYVVFEKAFWDGKFRGLNFVWLNDEELPEPLAAARAFTCKKGERQWWRGLLGAYRVLKQPTILELWLSGNDAIALEAVERDEDVLFVCWKLLECFFGASIPVPVQIIRTAWSKVDYIYGSYTSLAPGSSPEDIDSLAEPITVKGVPRVLFAGEATCRKYFSTVHGAYISGVREAGRLLSHYNQLSSAPPAKL